ncbi:phosphate ABC transporter substrate-binding protein [Scytonema sp. UIC 10036]|uniref:substrate-binding domain-containing protein n=1 Tax=Scytonema sp. UIC 10036 TaxID=2304196 RepID=UPI0012DA97D9|nr:substrate-binding domain-containing protein [Scytonema sp. UIC 10036]MUG99144.1 phosphate ABC transporter substrate-binding protein [Scytonema sp. UIC 10036]
MKNSLWLIATLVICIFLGELSGCTTSNIHQFSTNILSGSQAYLEIKIGSHGSTYLAMKTLADAYTSQVKNVHISFVPMAQSMVALKGVRDELLDISSVDEELKLEDSTLEYSETAKDALLVATHPSVSGITNLTTENLRAIYSGKLRNWQDIGGPDATIVVLDLPEDDSVKRLQRKHYLGKDLKNSKTAILLLTEEDAIAAVQNIPYSIGVFSSAYVTSKQLRLNPLTLNGVEATLENVQTGRYQMVRPIGIISKKSSSQAVKAFLQFVRCKQAASVLQKSGFLPRDR